jgi:hypothetical protein
MLEGAYRRFSNGWANFYPPLPYLIQAALSAPLMGYLMLSGGLEAPSPIFPFGLTDPLSTMTYIILIGRLWSALLGVGIVLVLYLAVQELFDRRSAIFSALIVTLYYPLVYYAHNANVDVPYLFWTSLAIYFFVRVLKYGILKDYVLFALVGMLAICTKDQAYGLFLLSPLPILWARYSEAYPVTQRPRWIPLLCDRRFVTAGLVAVGTFILAQNLVFNFTGFINHVRLAVRASAPYVAYAPDLSGRLHLLWATVLQLQEGLTLPIFVFCVTGCIYCIVKFPRKSLPLLFLASSYYVLLVNVVRYVPLRFVLPIGIIMAFFGGELCARMWQRGPILIVRRIAIAGSFAYAALATIQLDLLLINDPRYGAEQWLRENARKGAIIETFAPRETALKHYPRFPEWTKVRSSRLESGTQWFVRVTRRDRTTLPNLYEGRENPDYVILSKYWYGELLKPEARKTIEAQVLRDLFEGRIGYELVATFETASLVPIVGLPINPRIDIFASSKRVP